MLQPEGRWKGVLGVASGWLLILIVFFAALWLHTRGDTYGYAVTALTGLAGVALGWLLGLLASPNSDLEAERFSKYAAAASAFASGYLLSKLEPTIAAVLADGKLLHERLYGARALVFATCTIVAAISMYVYRVYLLLDEKKADDAVKRTGQPG